MEMALSELRPLIGKYNRPGPRYTSYPTALQFTDTDDPMTLLAECASSTAPLSLYVHLPFCESLCWFCACTTVISCNRNLADVYLDALEKEIDLTLPYLNAAHRPVGQLHLGGGSPSFLTANQLQRLGKMIRQRFEFATDAECSVELDPRTLDEDKVSALAAAGFRRASFGVQDVDPAVQKAVHRMQPDELNRRCLAWCRAAGFESINVDLIYGLPAQTPDSFKRTLDTVINYDPDRLAVFSYAHVPWVAPAQKILEAKRLPDPESKFNMLLQTITSLTDAGYHYVGMDHFAKVDDEIVQALHNGSLHRNFQGYTTKAGLELCGFGMSSISQSNRTYRQNFKNLEQWHAALKQDRIPIQRGVSLSDDDILRRDVIMSIMCSGFIDYDAYNQRYGIDFTRYFAGALEQLAALADDKLVSLSAGGFRVTQRGRLLLRNIAIPFDATFKEAPQRHAKTI